MIDHEAASTAYQAVARKPPRTEGASRARIVLLTGGALAALVALVLLVAGGALLAVDQTKRGADGYFAAPPERFQTTSYALASDGLEIVTDAPHWLFDGGRLGTVRIGTTSNDGKKIFVGVAAERDVAAYLAGTLYDEVGGVEYDPFSVDYRRHAGDATPDAPGAQPFWHTSVSGAGTQTLSWEVRSGRWAIVVMNADASPGVDAQVALGAKVDFLLEAAIGLLAGGGAALLVGGTLLFFGRRAGRPMP